MMISGSSHVQLQQLPAVPACLEEKFPDPSARDLSKPDWERQFHSFLDQSKLQLALATQQQKCKLTSQKPGWLKSTERGRFQTLWGIASKGFP